MGLNIPGSGKGGEEEVTSLPFWTMGVGLPILLLLISQLPELRCIVIPKCKGGLELKYYLFYIAMCLTKPRDF